ncbi:MAG: hypothetical protein AB1635_19465 [Acidobacteriota bacterium]
MSASLECVLDSAAGAGINYSAHVTRLMRDLVARVPELGDIDLDRVLVFLRQGRTGADGPLASCHCLSLPDTEPGYFFWEDAATGRITRRSEWFVTRSPRVELGGRVVDFLISLSMPRFCDQRLSRSRKRRHYPVGTPDWIARLDTIVHELYHIDSERRALREFAGRLHAPDYAARVAGMVQRFLDMPPAPEVIEFLQYDGAGLVARYGSVHGVTFRSYPAFPRRYREAVAELPPPADLADARVEPVRDLGLRSFSEQDLRLRAFSAAAALPRIATTSSSS